MDKKELDQILALQNIIQNAPIAIWAVDINGIFTIFQNGIKDLVITERDLIGKSHFELYKDFPEMIKSVKRALGGERFTEDGCAKGKWYSTSYSPVRDDKNQIIGMSAVSLDISDKKLIEKKLVESEKRFRVIADIAPVLICFLSPEGKCTWFNKSWLEFTGHTLDQELEGGWQKCVHPEDLERCQKTLDEQLQDPHPFEITYRLKHHSGEYHWIHKKLVPRFDAQENFEGFIGACYDVQEQTVSKEHLALREAYYRSLVDSLPLIVWTARPDGYLDYYNERWYEFTGFDHGEGGDQSWEPILHPDDAKACLDTWYSSVKNGKPYEIQYRFYDKKTDTYRWHLGRAIPARGRDGKIVKWFGSCTDIHEQKLIEETALLILETIPQGIWRTDPEGNADYVSTKFIQTVGYDQKELLGWEWTKKIHPDDYERVIQNWNESRAAHLPVAIEFRILNKDGSYKWYLSLGNPFFNKKGKLTQYYGTWTDISTQVHAIAARDEFLSIASHELKTPLTSLIIQTQLHRRLMDKGDNKAFSKEYITKVQNQTEILAARLARLIDDMLDISRIRSGKLKIEKTQTDICKIINDVVTRMLPNLIASGCGHPSVNCEVIKGQWDAFRIEQVIINILTNAMRYGKNKPININVKKQNENIVISIQDFGIGIAAKDIEKIFNRFERAVNAKDISGLGLGLFITEQIVLAHSGKIWVESALGKGSTFFVELPISST